jgi:uncharacterized small protein (DUF1192 family)
MPAFDDDDRPKKKVAHEIGQDLTLLSVQELNERIELMRAEIARLEADIARKRATRSAADQFFKTSTGPNGTAKTPAATWPRKNPGRFKGLLSFLDHYSDRPTFGHRVAPVHSV